MAFTVAFMGAIVSQILFATENWHRESACPYWLSVIKQNHSIIILRVPAQLLVMEWCHPLPDSMAHVVCVILCSTTDFVIIQHCRAAFLMVEGM